MAQQLSVFDKQRHHSDKDFTCSIGKHDVVYITFRHNTWERFTSGEHISVYVGNKGLKFGDPKELKDTVPCFKLKAEKKGNEATKQSTRYVQIDGKKYPAIIEAVRSKCGSYDFPKPEEAKKSEATEYLKKIMEEAKPVVVSDEPIPEVYHNAVAEAFIQDVMYIIGTPSGVDTEVAIVRALEHIYTMPEVAPKTYGIRLLNTQDDKSKWEV